MNPVEDRPTRRADVDAVDVDGELVLWDPRSRRVHQLDPVGSLLWPFLDGGPSIADLADDVAEVWGVPTADAEAAVAGLVEQLRAASLLVDLDEGGAPTPPPAPTHLVDPPSP